MVIAPLLNGEPEMLLFVTRQDNDPLTSELEQRIRRALKETNSPRHVPDRILLAPSIPYTITGKRLEVPIRRILEGLPASKVANPDLMRDPASLDWYVKLSQNLTSGMKGQ